MFIQFWDWIGINRKRQTFLIKGNVRRRWALSVSDTSLKVFFGDQDNTGELDTDRQEELKRARGREEEEEEKSRKSALLFGSEDTFDSIASLEEKVCTCFCRSWFEEPYKKNQYYLRSSRNAFIDNFLILLMYYDISDI